MGAVTPLRPPLHEISLEARPYPAHLLPEGGTGLALFAAAFLGHNDSIHFARKNMIGTCVDSDSARLLQMARIYPADWDFHIDDAWDFAERMAEAGAQWDVVSVDTFRGDATERSMQNLTLWTSLARYMVTATYAGEEYETPDGWEAFVYPRTSDMRVSWLVLGR